MLKQRFSRGDTLIEVLFAITVFSLVMVISLSLMNQGMSASIRSMQITLARQQVDSQAETLRFLNSSYVTAYQPGVDILTTPKTPAGEYKKILASIPPGKASVSAFGANGEVTCPAVPAGSFITNARTAEYLTSASTSFVPADGVAEVIYGSDNVLTQSKGLWIEAVRSPQVPGERTRYTDFHIRACWSAPGVDEPMNIGTIVRLYEPSN